MYTSVYNDSQARQSEIRNALAQEAGGVHTAMLLVRTLDADDNINKTRALRKFTSNPFQRSIDPSVLKRSAVACDFWVYSETDCLCFPVLFSSYIENLATEIFFKSRKHKGEVMPSSIEALYAAIPFLAEIASDGEGDEMDRVLIQRVVDALNRT